MLNEAEIMVGNLNWIDGMIHAVRCPMVLSGGSDPCDCSPLDSTKAMRGGDVLRVFAPLPQHEADALRQFLKG